jgi:hypothetical protein
MTKEQQRLDEARGQDVAWKRWGPYLCPTGSGKQMTLFEVSQEIANRLQSIFLRDTEGRRPVFGGAAKFQNDPPTARPHFVL